jgi:hypothetical protein
MALRQKMVSLIGGSLVGLMLLFPPWDYFDPDTSGRQSAGFHFFLTPPQPRPAKELLGERLVIKVILIYGHSTKHPQTAF